MDTIRQITNLKLSKDLKELKIGRTKENDLTIEDLSVSKNHAEIRCVNKIFYLIDKKSLNGTYVNREKLDTEEMKEIFHGDKITFGRYINDFLIEIEGKDKEKDEIMERIKNKIEILELLNFENFEKINSLKIKEKMNFEKENNEFNDELLENFEIYDNINNDCLKKIKDLNFLEKQNDLIKNDIRILKLNDDNENLENCLNYIDKIKSNYKERISYLIKNKKIICDKLSQNINQLENEYGRMINKENDCEKKWLNLIKDNKENDYYLKSLQEFCEKQRESCINTELKFEKKNEEIQIKLNELNLIKDSNESNFEKQNKILKISSKMIFDNFKDLQKEISDTQVSNEELKKIINEKEFLLKKKKNKIKKFENIINSKIEEKNEFGLILKQIGIYYDYLYELENTDFSILINNVKSYNFLKGQLKIVFKESEFLEKYFLDKKKNNDNIIENKKLAIKNLIKKNKSEENLEKNLDLFNTNKNIYHDIMKNDVKQSVNNSMSSRDMFVKEIIINN